MPYTVEQRQTFAGRVHDRLNPIMDLLTNPKINEIKIRRGGKFIFAGRGTDCPLLPGREFAELESAVRNVAASIDKEITRYQPHLEARLDDFNARLTATFPPIARDGAICTIRRFPKRFTMDELVGNQSVSPSLHRAIRTAIDAKETFLISGSPIAGKTTLLNAILTDLPPNEHVCVLEKEGEIVSDNPYVTMLETLDAKIRFDKDGIDRSAITLSDLVTMILRHSPGRLFIGEVRSAEAGAMLMAQNTGNQGGACTIHANSANDALWRLARLAMLASPNMSYESALLDVGSAINIVLHIAIDKSTQHRYVAQAFRVHRYNHEGRAFHLTPLLDEV